MWADLARETNHNQKVAGRHMSGVARSQERRKAPFSSETVLSNRMGVFKGAGHSALSSGKHADGTIHAGPASFLCLMFVPDKVLFITPPSLGKHVGASFCSR